MKGFLIAFLIVLVTASSNAQQTVEADETKRRLASAEKKLSDWPELSRYRDANLKLLQLPHNKERVVFIGDSITDLWDDDRFGGFFPGKPYVDRGISGQTTPQMLVRFRADVLDLKPSVVVILAGTNDISGNTGPMTLEQTGANIASMAELATANGVKVVLSSVIPVSDTVKRQNGEPYIQTVRRPPVKIAEMNRWLRTYAEKNGYTYLDYSSAMVDSNGFVKDGLTFDGLHPNTAGYAVMMPLAEKAISASRKSRK